MIYKDKSKTNTAVIKKPVIHVTCDISIGLFGTFRDHLFFYLHCAFFHQEIVKVRSWDLSGRFGTFRDLSGPFGTFFGF